MICIHILCIFVNVHSKNWLFSNMFEVFEHHMVFTVMLV